MVESWRDGSHGNFGFVYDFAGVRCIFVRRIYRNQDSSNVVGENLHAEVSRSENKQNAPWDSHGRELACGNRGLEAESGFFFLSSFFPTGYMETRVWNYTLSGEEDWYFARMKPPKESHRVETTASVCERTLVEVIVDDKVGALGVTAG